MAGIADTNFIRLTFELAEKGRGKTSPNPMVGAVIVRGNHIVGKGCHRAVGSEHAEVAAIRMAASRSQGATLYVNLEPCCHFGRTGPCTEAIVKAGISRVVLSTKDPNPVVNGKGIRQLRKAGIRVDTGLLKNEARRLNETYMGYHEKKRPYVILKLAQSLDGRIAAAGGDARWISSPQSRRFVHRLRAQVDAVVVGAGTVRQDNPSLTVRHVRGDDPYRIVLTESLDIPAKSNLLVHNGDLKTIIASSRGFLKRVNTTAPKQSPVFWTVRRVAKNLLDLNDFLAKADQFGLQSILVEGGGKLATEFLKANLVDKLILITAPILLGQGTDSFGDLGIRKVTEAMKFNTGQCFSSGPDTIFVGYPQAGV